MNYHELVITILLFLFLILYIRIHLIVRKMAKCAKEMQRIVENQLELDDN